MIKLNINMAYCDFLKEEPGSENNRTDRKLFMRPFSMVKKKRFFLGEFFTPAIICCQCQSNS
jgi:hypothetical protein